MVFSVPTPDTFRKLKRNKGSKLETYTDQKILTVCETPLIPENDSLSQDINNPMSEEQSENIPCDLEASTKEFKNSPKCTSNMNNVESQEESDETQPPSDIVVPSTVKHSKSPISQSYSNDTETEMVTEVESSVENSVSLLNQHDADITVIDIVNNKEDKNEENEVEEDEPYVDVKEPVPKSKKKRKSFMLDEDDDTASSLSVSSPVQNTTKQVPKRKKLSRSAQKSNTDIENPTKNQSLNNVVRSKNVQSNSNGNQGQLPVQKSGLILSKNTLSSLESEQDAENSLSPGFNVDKSLRSRTKMLQMASMDVVTISESAQSDLNTVDPQTLTASCVPQTNSDEHVRANSPIKSRQLIVEDSDASYKDDLINDVNDEPTSKDVQKVSQSENIYMVPESEIINCSDTPGMIADCSVATDVNLDKDTEDSQCPKTMEIENNHKEHEKSNSQSVSTNFEIDKSQEVQNPMKKPNSSRKSKTAKKRNSQSQDLDLKTRGHKQTHLSGMLNSPDENILCSVGNGSPEDIFNMDSELPFVDNSPLEGEIQPVCLSEETITNDMSLAQEKKSEHVGSNAQSNNSHDNTDHDLSRIHVKVEKKETTLRQRKGRQSTNNEFNEAKHGKAESDSESDLSQQAKKRKRQSGVKGARGLANRKKQSGSSNSNSDLGSPLLPGTPGFKKNTFRKIPNKTGLETATHKEVIEPSVIDLSDSSGNQNNDNNKLHAEIDDNETTNDLPDLSQRMSQKQKHNIDADSNIVSSAISHVEESGTELANSVIHIDYEKQKDLANIRLGDKELRQSENEMKAIGNDADSTSSEFELSSSSEHSQNHLEKTEPEDIDKCIKEAKDKITDIENTLSEIIDKDSDDESHSLSQEDKDNVIDGKTLKHKELRNSIGVKTDGHYQNVDTSSPLPDINTEEPMEVLESDIEVYDNDGPMSKNSGIRNIDSDQGPMVEENGTRERNSDSDEGPVTKKKSKKAVIADSSSEDEGTFTTTFLYFKMHKQFIFSSKKVLQHYHNMSQRCKYNYTYNVESY